MNIFPWGKTEVEAPVPPLHVHLKQADDKSKDVPYIRKWRDTTVVQVLELFSILGGSYLVFRQLIKHVY